MQRALIIVDVQRGFDDPSWGVRDNLSARPTSPRLLAAWRQAAQLRQATAANLHGEFATVVSTADAVCAASGG